MEGPRLKIQRADEHIFHLHIEIRAFVQANPYSVLFQKEPDSAEHIAYAKAALTPPPRWSLIVGDIVHNLRSALDHLACQISELGGNTKLRGVYFPIDTKGRTAEELENYIRGKVKKAPDRAITIFKGLQPTEPCEEHPLYILHELDRLDKHRFLHFSRHRVTLDQFSLKNLTSGTDETIPMIDSPTQTIEGQTEILRVSFNAAEEENVNMEAKVTFFVAFDEDGPGGGKSVIPTLQRLMEATTGAVNAFEPLFRDSS